MARKDFRKATFRGIEFKVVGQDSEFGRRTVKHEFAKRDDPYQEDLGRKSRSFTFEAYILGSDFRTQRDSLIAACEVEGPGELIHPAYGSKQVVCTACRVRESSGEARAVRFQLTFEEAGALLFPASKIDPSSKLLDAGLGVKSSAQTFLESTYEVVSKPAFIVSSAEDKLSDFSDTLEDSKAKISGPSETITDLAFGIRNFRADIADLARDPSLMGQRLIDALDLLSGAATGKRDSYDAQRNLFAFGNTDIVSSVDTPSRNIQKSNSNAINLFVKSVVVSNAANDAAAIPFKSDSDAVTVRTQLFELMDEILDTVEDDNLYQAVQDLRTQTANAIPEPDKKLPSIVTFRIAATRPSLDICYELYGNLDNEQDIIDRNSVKNPGFVPGGEPLQVLTSG